MSQLLAASLLRVSTFVAAAIVLLASSPSLSLAQLSIIGKSIQERQASPGDTYSGSVTVRNDGSQPLRVQSYLRDYRFAATGAVGFPEAGSTRRSNASWLSVSPSVLVVAPGESATVGYTVTLPALAGESATGTYWSMLMIQGGPVQALAQTATQSRLTTVIRQGIQIVTHLGESGVASVALSNARLVPDSTGTALHFDAANDGVRARRLSLSLDLYAEDGRFIGRFTKSRGLLYPGLSIRQAFSLGQLAKGNYLALVVADADQEDLFAGKFKLTL